VMHPALDHIGRLKGRDPGLWNQAGDYVINQLLVESGVGKMPKQGLYDPALYAECEGVTEKIYGRLKQEDDPEGPGRGKGKAKGNGGKESLDTMVPSDGTPSEQTDQRNDAKVKMVQAAQAAKMAGKLPAGVARLVRELLEPQLDWRTILQNFVTKYKDDSRTFARPNRRFLPQGLYLPSRDGERTDEIAVAIDCSGSIDMDKLHQFVSEVQSIVQDTRPSRLHVLYFDTEVSHHDTFEPDDHILMEPHGGGGTRFSPVFRYMQEHHIDAVCCVFLTDLDCRDFGSEPHYPVLWVSYDKTEAPFGEVVTF